MCACYSHPLAFPATLRCIRALILSPRSPRLFSTSSAAVCSSSTLFRYSPPTLSPHTLTAIPRNNAALSEKLGPVTGGLAFRTEKEKIRRGMVPGDDGSITLTPIFNIVSLFAEFDDERISPIIGRRSRVSFDLSALLF